MVSCFYGVCFVGSFLCPAEGAAVIGFLLFEIYSDYMIFYNWLFVVTCGRQLVLCYYILLAWFVGFISFRQYILLFLMTSFC
jgi:hypothetical protein